MVTLLNVLVAILCFPGVIVSFSSMVTKKPFRHQKNYRLWDNQDMLDAYEAVKKGMSCNMASKMFYVPGQTLRDRVNGKVDIGCTTNGRAPVFSTDEESQIVDHLKKMAKTGHGYTRQEIVDMANAFAVKVGKRTEGNRLTLRWFRGFRDRWPEVNEIRSRKLKPAIPKSTSKENDDEPDEMPTTGTKQVPTRSFIVDYENNTFLKDGKPFRYVSGSIHYSRVPQFYWKDRLLKMYAAGLDAIQLYIPWNIHQPLENTFDFEGQNDIVRFIATAKEIGLLVVLRAGPYIDGEWEFGGLPAWILQKNPNTVFRTMDPTYIHYVDLWLDKLLPMLRPLVYSNGGPVIMVQIENEYGSYYACDRNYTSHLRDKFVSHLHDEVLLFTTDGTLDSNFKCGPIPGIFATTDFGVYYTPEKGFKPLRKYQPNGPLVNSEFYTGWLDHWGHRHETVSKLLVEVMLDVLLNYGASVNMYMFEGGTNFGYWNGANDLPYLPVPTSYDYDAPLTEAGDITEKYKLISHVISKHKPMPPIPCPPSTPKANYGPVKMNFVGSILDLLDHLTHGPPIKSMYPVSMEAIGQFQGFTLYRHTLTSDLQKNTILNVPGVRDRAYVMINKVSVGVLMRDTRTSLSVAGMKGQNLDILVENQGHITFNRGINYNLKGIIQNVTLGGQVLQGWTMYPLQLDNYFNLTQKIIRSNRFKHLNVTVNPGVPSLYMGKLTITSDLQDTYLDLTGWRKGQAFIKSQAVVNLGRYWPLEGPQVRLFVPGPYLQRGSKGNQILLVELEGSPCVSDQTCVVNLVDTPLINGPVQGHR